MSVWKIGAGVTESGAKVTPFLLCRKGTPHAPCIPYHIVLHPH